MLSLSTLTILSKPEVALCSPGNEQIKQQELGSYSCAVVARLADLSDPFLYLVVGLFPDLEILYTEARRAEHWHLHCAAQNLNSNHSCVSHHNLANPLFRLSWKHAPTTRPTTINDSSQPARANLMTGRLHAETRGHMEQKASLIAGHAKDRC